MDKLFAAWKMQILYYLYSYIYIFALFCFHFDSQLATI